MTRHDRAAPSARSWISGLGLAAGAAAVAGSLTVTETAVGAGLTLGFGAFIAFFALLSLLVRNRAPSYFGLLVVGVATFLMPFLGEAFVTDRGAAWTAWVAGFAAMVLGGVGWLRSIPPAGLVAPGAQPAGSAERGPIAWLSRAALGVGVATVLAAIVMPASTAGVVVNVGLGGMAAVIGLWSLLAADATRDYMTLAIVGFALFVSPWVVGFVGEPAGATASIAGAIVTALGLSGYLRAESISPRRARRRATTEAR
ncbi:SPW repeat domain-containing protein [Mycolicibacterium sp. XJ1819]